MNSKRRRHSKRYTSKYRYSEEASSRASFTMRSLSFRISAVVFLVALVVFIISKLQESDVDASSYNTPVSDSLPQRIISLAPSVTETLFAVGADGLLVGVTQYCKYPPEADTLPEVGGFLDPNLEALLALEPDLVIMLRESEEFAAKLRKLGLKTLLVNHQTVNGVLESYSAIGAHTGFGETADSIRTEQEKRLEQIKKLTKHVPRPTALISIGHSDQPEVIKNVYVAGSDDFYSTLLEIAGGSNVVTDTKVRYPIYNTEGITALDPEYVLDLFPSGESDESGEKPLDHSFDHSFVMNQWKSLPNLRAVKHNRIVVLAGTYLVIPGPRMLKIAESFLAALHPQIAAEYSTK